MGGHAPFSTGNGHTVCGIDSAPLAGVVFGPLITRPAFGTESDIRRGPRRVGGLRSIAGPGPGVG